MPCAKLLNGIALSMIAFSAVADDPPRAFELADVHPSPPTSVWTVSAMREPTLAARLGQLRGGRYEIRSATLVDLISAAYTIDPAKLISGPPWLDTARFDVIASVPAGTTPALLPAMLQSLLVDRFHLITHSVVNPFPEFVLTSGPRHQLKTSGGGADSGCKRAAPKAAPQAEAGITCRDISLAQFAQVLPQIAGDYFQGNKLIDQTQLTGSFDFDLHWTPRNKFVGAGGGGVSLASALQKQLGLNLAMHDIPEAALIVDQADRVPTPNAPAVARLLPPVALAFEVATIKPTSPEVTQRRVRIDPGGPVEIQGLTLKSLIKSAWDLEDLDAIDNEDLLSGAPKFSESVRYDVVASAPATGPIDRDSLKLMLRALLADRFGLITHVEPRTITVLALVASKPNLQRAEPRGRSGCRNVSMNPQSAMASVPIFSVRCRNTTMAQLAQKLQAFAGRYVTHPAIDATGLTGAYDFAMNWSPPHLVDDPTPSDPNGSISLVEALDKQLGLKLKPIKHIMPITVIDHLNPTPTPN
jgi:uncharacterized protein (TIGR03435 family)